jgi:tetrahydromethanopterin S-methyltransferase subunit G
MTLKERSDQPPQHCADLAGSLAVRKVLQRDAEIAYGLVLGLLMWLIDAAVHGRNIIGIEK